MKLQAKISDSKKSVKSRKPENKQLKVQKNSQVREKIQVQEKIKFQEKYQVQRERSQLPIIHQVQENKFESISSIHRSYPKTQPETTRPARVEQTQNPREAMKKIIEKLKTDNGKLQLLVQSKDVTIKLQNEEISDLNVKLDKKVIIIQKFKTIHGNLNKEVAELNETIQELSVTTDSGHSISKSRISENNGFNQASSPIKMPKNGSVEFLEFRTKLYRFYQKNVHNKNKDPETSKLIKDLKSQSSKQKQQQFFDSFVTRLAKNKFAAQDQVKKARLGKSQLESGQLKGDQRKMKKKKEECVKKLAELLRVGLKNKDPKFENLRAKLKKLSTAEKKVLLKQFINDHVERQLAKKSAT